MKIRLIIKGEKIVCSAYENPGERTGKGLRGGQGFTAVYNASIHAPESKSYNNASGGYSASFLSLINADMSQSYGNYDFGGDLDGIIGIKKL